MIKILQTVWFFAGVIISLFLSSIFFKRKGKNESDLEKDRASFKKAIEIKKNEAKHAADDSKELERRFKATGYVRNRDSNKQLRDK